MLYRTELPLHLRLRRRLLTPISRLLVLCDRGSRLMVRATPPRADVKLPVFMIVIPGGEDMARKSSSKVAEHCRLCLILNGYSRRAAREFRARLPAVPTIRLRTLPRVPVKHGTALTVLLRHAEENFAVIDPDCFVRDHEMFQIPAFEQREFLAAPDHPDFFNTNRITGERFPRTHFLVANVTALRQLMSEHGISAEKYKRAPRRLRALLAERGYGRGNYPRSHLRQFDTLLLLMAVGFQRGLRVRWLRADSDSLVHWRHHASRIASLRARESLELD